MQVRCRTCEKNVELRLNPRIVGLLIDETGSIACGKLIWSEEAWWQLLGRCPEELLALNKDQIAYLEQRILFLRMTILFGWNSGVGRITVLQMVTL